MIDTWRLNSLVSNLMAPGETFDPDVARELFDALPVEKPSPITIRHHSSSTSHSTEGLTNLGSFSFEDKKEKSSEYGRRSKGTYVGRWRVTRMSCSIQIEPRFFGSEAQPHDEYELRFSRESVQFLKAHFQTLRIPLPFVEVAFRFVRMKPWKRSAI